MRKFPRLLLLYLCFLPYLTGCGTLWRTEADAQPRSEGAQQEKGGTAVEVAIAKSDTLQDAVAYVGSTSPVREVSIRSQAEGRLLDLAADVGDPVRQGQSLARLDDALLKAAVNEAQAELAARKSEVASLTTQVGNARAQAESVRLELRQAQADARRLRSLAQSGAIAEQEAEFAQTTAATAQQAVEAATQQIRTEQQAVLAAQERVVAQQAIVAQTVERLSYTSLTAPLNGIVLERVTEPGNLVTPGSEVLKVGDFSRVKVVVPVSELELAEIRVGQAVTVRLDAFPEESFTGEVTRRSPAANATTRQVPIEVTIPNPEGEIGSGLLARVSFESNTLSRVVIPESALQESPEQEQKSTPAADATLFIVTGDGAKATVQARQVRVGDRVNGNVEILSGLQVGERFVAQTGKPLKDGETVRLSVLSEQ